MVMIIDLCQNYKEQLTYKECRKLIDKMGFESAVFGIEKEDGKLNGILALVYQNVFGQELYPSIEEKAANLLYFLIKDRPFCRWLQAHRRNNLFGIFKQEPSFNHRRKTDHLR